MGFEAHPRYGSPLKPIQPKLTLVVGSKRSSPAKEKYRVVNFSEVIKFLADPSC